MTRGIASDLAPSQEQAARADRVSRVLAPGDVACFDALERLGRAAGGKVVIGGMPSGAVEQYRRLAATLHHAQQQAGIRVVMIASAVPGEGKTLSAVNLALTLSESYRRKVVLVDADLRRPTVHHVLGLPDTAGLNDVLASRDESAVPLLRLSPRLAVLTAGRPNPDPLGGITSDRMRAVIRETAERADWVILDTPPVAMLSDANLLAAMVDVVVLVVCAGRAPLRLLERAADALGRERIIGALLNQARVQRSDAYGYAAAYYGTLADGGER